MLILVRHGRTGPNASGRFLGRLDAPLDEVGEAQARAVADVVARGRVAAIVTSPLVRARRTADAVAERTGVSVSVDDRWVELDYGTLDGTPLADLPPAVWQQWRSDPGFRPGGGESLSGVAERVVPACEELLAEAAADDRDVVVVTHVSPLKVALCWSLGVDPGVGWRTFVAPGSVTRVRAGPTGPVLTSFNEQPLLPPQGSR